MLSLHQLTKTYARRGHPPHHAVNEVSLHLDAGVTGLVGHNGAGKTTLMNMLATLVPPTSGRIEFMGQDILSQRQHYRSRLGYLPQDFDVYPHLSALEFLQYMATLKGVDNPGRVQQVLERVNLHGQQHRLAASFSGGMKRRLGIAQALLNDPLVLIVDEPTAGLDPEERWRFRTLLEDLGDSRCILLSTHIVSDIEDLAQRVAIMRQGQLVADHTPDDFIRLARGQVWSARLNQDAFAQLPPLQVLSRQRLMNDVLVRIAHPYPPCEGAVEETPSLEEALMALRYAQAEGVAS